MPEGTGANYEHLLATGDGRCGAWADFLIAVISAQVPGTGARKSEITPKVPTLAPPPGYGYAGTSGIVVKEIPAQGTGSQPYTAQTSFTDHAVVKMNLFDTTIFDPSYGKRHERPSLNPPAVWTMEDAEKAWENASLVECEYDYKKTGAADITAKVSNQTASLQANFTP